MDVSHHKTLENKINKFHITPNLVDCLLDKDVFELIAGADRDSVSYLEKCMFLGVINVDVS